MWLCRASALVMFSIFLCPSLTLAATVKPLQGDVLVNRGSGYEHVRGTSQASVGDIVMARPGGRAQVVYNDTCSVAVRPGQVVAIASEPPCHKTAAFDADGTRMNLGACSGKGVCEPEPQGDSWLPLAALGAAAVVGGLCIAEQWICEDNPASANGRHAHHPTPWRHPRPDPRPDPQS